MTQTRKKGEITFFQVRSSSEKLKVLIEVGSKYFYNKQSILFLTPSKAASLYLDELLWKRPLESFLPHGSYSPSSRELVQIGERLPVEGHGFKALFNLGSGAVLDSDIKTIFELEDLTTAEKAATFTPRYEAYAQSGYQIISSCNGS